MKRLQRLFVILSILVLLSVCAIVLDLQTGTKENITYAEGVKYTDSITVSINDLGYGMTKAGLNPSVTVGDDLKVKAYDILAINGMKYSPISTITAEGNYCVMIVLEGDTSSYYFANNADGCENTVTLSCQATPLQTITSGAEFYNVTKGMYAESDTPSENVYLVLMYMFELTNQTVTYNKNTVDTVNNMPTNEENAYLPNQGVTLPAVTPTRANYIFEGWATESNGDTLTTATVPMGLTGLTLFAKWRSVNADTRSKEIQIDCPDCDGGCATCDYVGYTTVIGNLVTLNTNGVTPNEAIVQPSAIQTGSNFSSFPILTANRFIFKGWSTDSKATAATYTNESSYTVNGDVTFYAIWQGNGNSYTYEWLETNFQPYYLAGDIVTFVAGPNEENGEVIFVNNVYTAAIEQSKRYSYTIMHNGAIITNPDDFFYNISDVECYAVTYNINGGTGTAPTETALKGIGYTITLPAGTGLTYAGYIFDGWNVDKSAATGNTGEYIVTSNDIIDGAIKFYAIWKECTSHEWNSKDGKCKKCGTQCLHDWENSVCNTCGYVCTHANYYRVDSQTDDSDHVVRCADCNKLLLSGDHTYQGSVCSLCFYHCTHGSTTDYNTNETQHWIHCVTCGQDTAELGDHVYQYGFCTVCGYECSHTDWTDGVCDVCGYTCTHNWSNSDGVCAICGTICPHSSYEYCKNASQHWHECTTCGMSQGDEGFHNFSTGICICGLSCYHSPNSYKYNDTYHWKECDQCGATVGSTENHDFSDGTCKCGKVCSHTNTTYVANDDEDHNIICDDCSTVLNTESHNYQVDGSDMKCTLCNHICTHGDSTYDNDATQHWKVCDYCDKTFDNGTHDWSSKDGKCTVCDYECPHDAWNNSVCTACGYECTNHDWSDNNGICGTCGYECTSHDWNYGSCSNCHYECPHTTLYLNTDNVDDECHEMLCEVCDYSVDDGPVSHTYSNGVCTVCNYTCTHAHALESIYWETGLTDHWLDCDCCNLQVNKANHDWSDKNGKCKVCDFECPHDAWNNSVCTTCGYECTDHDWSNCDGVCVVCGYECTSHDWNLGSCSNCHYECPHTNLHLNTNNVDDGWHEMLCVVCDYSVNDGLVAHTYSNGKCTVCEYTCTHSSAIANEDWENDTTHHWLECSCNLTVNKLSQEEHDWSGKNGICKTCAYICEHDNWNNSVCTVCEYECTSHNWVDGACSTCNYDCPHTTLYLLQATVDDHSHEMLCTVCNYCVESKTHTYNDGKCTVCEYTCTHSTAINDEIWENDLTDHWLECTECEKTIQKANHDWSDKNGKCKVCEYECTHTAWNNSVCTACGYECTDHDWSDNNGICGTCGYECNVTITETPQNKTFDGTKQTFDIVGQDKDIGFFVVKYYVENAWTETAPINAGTYDIKISRAKDATHDEYIKIIANGLSIEKGNTVITVDQTPIVKTYGEEITIPNATATFGEVNCDKQITDLVNAGSYTITYTVADTDNYNGDTKTVSVTINKATAVITVDQTPIVKTYGEEITIPTATATFGEVNCDKQTTDLVNADSYTITYTVADTDNYNGDTKTVSVTINKIAVNEPTVVGSYKYTGEAQTVVLTGVESYMTTTDKLTQTDIGVYTITYILDSNHNWADGSDGVIVWEIKALEITDVTEDTTENPQIKVQTEEGFDSTITVTVEVTVEVEVETKELTVDYYNLTKEDTKLADSEKVCVVFDVKLIQTIDGISSEIQPSDIEDGTKIKVKLLIPDSVNVKKITRILHVHSAEDIEEIEFDASKIDENGYYEIEVDRLSEFAFIYAKGSIVNQWCILGVVLLVITMLIIGILCVIRKRNQVVTIIHDIICAFGLILSFPFVCCNICLALFISGGALFVVGIVLQIVFATVKIKK